MCSSGLKPEEIEITGQIAGEDEENVMKGEE